MENAYCGASYYILFIKSDKVNADEINTAHSRHWRDKKCINNLAWKH
jgi:hypothetical protein